MGLAGIMHSFAALALLLTAVWVPAGVAAPVRRVRQKLPPITVSVGYGNFTYRVPQNASDSLPYFKTAIAALNKRVGTLIIGPGTFLFGYQWNITASNALIKGAGMGKTILKLKDKAPFFKSAGFITSYGTKNVTMTDMTIDGNKAKQVGTSKEATYGRFCVFMADYRDWAYRRIECQNWQEYGFDPHGVKKKVNGKFDVKAKTTLFSNGLIIEDCSSHDNEWDGITVDATKNVVIRNNVAYNNGRHGINIVTKSENVLVEGNRVWNNGQNPPGSFGCGLLADTNQPGFITKNVTFRNNSVRNQGSSGGACSKGAVNVLFENNTISDSVACAFFRADQVGVKFINNVCLRNKVNLKFSEVKVQPVVRGNIFK